MPTFVETLKNEHLNKHRCPINQWPITIFNTNGKSVVEYSNPSLSTQCHIEITGSAFPTFIKLINEREDIKEIIVEEIQKCKESMFVIDTDYVERF